MNARHPLLGPAVGLALGIAVGLEGVPFHPAALPALALALLPRLAPAAFVSAGWRLASASRAAPEGVPGAPVRIEGRVASVPDRLGDRIRFRLRDDRGRLLDAFAPPLPWPLALGDRVRFEAVLRVPPGRGNPAGRDTARRLAASGIGLQAMATGPAVRVAPPSPIARLERARERFAQAADRALPAREAALVRAIGTGDRSALDAATSASFARSGLAHVLAVSGLHLVVVAFGLERLLRSALLRIDAVAERVDPRKISAAAVLPACAAYALATGAGAPVLRAGIGAAVALAGALLERESSPLDALALSALALLAGDPGAALDPSFQLSFAAVAGLALWAGPMRRALPVPRARRGTWRARVVEPLLSGACATIAASVATAPVLACHFRQLPVLGGLANLAGVPLGSALTAISSVAALAAAAHPALAWPFLVASRPLASALIALSDAAAAPSWSALGVGTPGAAGTAAFFAAALLAGRARGAARLAAVAAAAAAILAPAPLRAAAARARGGLEVVFVSVGHGDAALLRLPDGSAVLVDAGGAPDGGGDPGARDVVPLLRDLGVSRLAAAFVSHPHPDHVLGFSAVAAAVPIDVVFSNGDGGDGASRAVLASLAPVTLAPGDGWQRAGVRFDALGGERIPLAPNDASLVLRASYGRTAFLFPGDVEAAGEAAALARGGLDADVVKIPHHGSRRSSSGAFAAAVGARHAVASVGARNRYGFPHAEALARWRAAGAAVLRTDEGAIRFLSDGRRVRRVPTESVLDPLAIWTERAHASCVRIEDIDLLEVAERLGRRIPELEPPVGYLRGRSYFRDVLVEELGCSDLEAEQLVDTLENNGYLRFSGDPSVRSRTDGRWVVDPHVP